MAERNNVGAFLAAARKRAGLKQDELAKQLGVTNKTVSRWERGQTRPDYEQLLALSRILNVDVYDLVSGRTDAKKEGILQKAAHETQVSTMEFEDNEEDESAKPVRKRRYKVTILVETLGLILLAGLAAFAITIGLHKAKSNTVTPTPSPSQQPFATPDPTEMPVITPSPTPEPTEEPDWITLAQQQYETVEYEREHFVTELPEGTVPEELAGRNQSDEQLLNLSNDELRASIGTVEDMIAWFRLTGPRWKDKDYTGKNRSYAYQTPEEKLAEENPSFGVDSISITAAWLLQDDYPGTGVLAVLDAAQEGRSKFYVCIPIKGGWYIFDTAQWLNQTPKLNLIGMMAVRDLSDLYPYYLSQGYYFAGATVDTISLHEGLDAVFIKDLTKPITFAQSNAAWAWTRTDVTRIMDGYLRERLEKNGRRWPGVRQSFSTQTNSENGTNP